MKVKIGTPVKSTELQKLVSELPFDATNEAEFKGLMFVEELLALMKQRGLNRTQLAERMEVGASRITAMLNGNSNFTLETLIRAGHAVGATLEQTLVPNGMKGRWVKYREDEVHSAFRPSQKKPGNLPFELETDEIASTDDVNAA